MTKAQRKFPKVRITQHWKIKGDSMQLSILSIDKRPKIGSLILMMLLVANPVAPVSEFSSRGRDVLIL